MEFMEIVRRRLTNEPQSHQIDDDYTYSNNNDIDPLATNGIALPISPYIYEDVPSYETSQLLYEHQIHHDAPSRNNSIRSAELARSASGTNIHPSPNTLSGGTTSPGGLGTPPSRKGEFQKSSLKQLGLKFLNARQHFTLAICRDISLIPALVGLFQSWKRVFVDNDQVSIDTLNSIANNSQHLNQSITAGRISEHFLTGVWCIVSAYLSYNTLDNLILRWIVTYSTPAAIVRVLSMSTIMITIEQYLVSTFSAEGYKYGLHIWILISCCLTLTYIGQNFVTSNIDLSKGAEKKARFFDIYNIVVFAVVPVGLASFITMVGLLRSLLILRIDIDQSQLTIS